MRHPIAWRGLAAIAVGYAVLLAAFATRYGYHRDEYYFIAIGGHPAFGYDDQPPLVPLLAHALDAISGGSLFVLRLPSAIAGAAIVLLTGLIAREFGATRGAQLLASGCMAVAAVLMAISHLMSTTTYDVLAWTVVSWLVVRALRDGGRTWLLVGLAAGIGLEIKTLLAFFLAALVIGVAVLGPRETFRDRWFWIGSIIAIVLWLPNVVWQANNGWPQLELSKAIANGSSGSSQPVWAFLPYQLLLVSPFLFPIWIAGLWRLARLRPWRAFVLAWLVLVVVFLATDGKPYYLAGMFPVLLAAGAARTAGRLSGRRRVELGVALGVSLAVAAVLFLPIVPASQLKNTPIVSINYDAGEQVGWPEFVAQVRGVYDRQPAGTVVITSNYGEAGALLHSADPPPTYARQNSMWGLGPPPAHTRTAVAVGFDRDELAPYFGSIRLAARIDNGVGLDNDEQDAPVWVVGDQRAAWSAIWDKLRVLG